MFEESLADIFITEREVGAPSIVFIDSGGAKKSVAGRSSTGRAGVAVNDRIPVASTADTAAAAAAATATQFCLPHQGWKTTATSNATIALHCGQ